MKLYLLILLTCVAPLGYSQGETNLWYFGNNAGIDFTAGIPTPVSNGQLNTIEGCTSISSEDGSLLFYTNGLTVWNKNHQVMVNGSGLFGDLSSSQAAVVVKKPGSGSTYYIFTTNPFTPNGGLRYSEIDMSLNAGSGAVIAKNVLLYEPTCEKIAIVNHSNNSDVWAVTHVYGTDEFRSFSITASGIDTNFVSSNSGIAITPDDDKANAIGYMKISPDGKKLVACHTFLRKAELFDFNDTTGQLSNPVLLSDENMSVYGAEFSTNSEVLYISTVDEKKLFQFNLKAEDVPSSKTLIATLSATLGAMQLGPDGKIYLAMAETNQLSVINSPDSIGTACSLQPFAIYLDSMCMLGLPSFNASFFDHSIRVENVCASSASLFTVTTGQAVDSILWNFGDNNTSTEINPSHIYAAAGDYTVTATATNANCTITKSRVVSILAAPQINNIASQSICIAASENYVLSTNNAAILNGQPNTEIALDYFITSEDAANGTNALSDTFLLQPGTVTFYVKATNQMSGCSTITSFSVSSYVQPGAMQPTDYIVCEAPYDGIASFDLTLKDAEILGGQDSTQFHVSYFQSESEAESGTNPVSTPYTNSLVEETLFARVSNNAETCFVIVPLKIVLTQQPRDIEISDYVVCDNGSYDGYYTFDLNTKDQEALADHHAPEFFVTYYTSFTDAQTGTSPVSGMFTNTEFWQTIYARVESANGGCMVITTFHLDVKECEDNSIEPFAFPNYFTPNGDGINDFWQITYSAAASVQISIFDRNGRLINVMPGDSQGWDGTSNGIKLPSSDYWFIATGKGVDHRGHFSLLNRNR